MSTLATETEVIYDISNAEIESAFEAWNDSSVNYNSLKETTHPV